VRILTVCTGNVARSAMLGFMLATLGEDLGLDWRVRTAGTHVIEGSTMSSRTRDALLAIDGLGEHRYSAHRSRQLVAEDLDWADVVLAAEADHVRFARALAPGAAGRVVQIQQFVEHAPMGRSLDQQLAVVARVELDAHVDVADPAGRDQSDYDACARSLWGLAQRFAELAGS
jgi:protein-tyrosine-phosphatase